MKPFAVPAPAYPTPTSRRPFTIAASFRWASICGRRHFSASRTSSSQENIYQFIGIKEVWQAAYAPHNIKHLNYLCSDEWGSMVSTRRVEKFADFKAMKVQAFGI